MANEITRETDPQSLLERVRKAEGADREIDALICATLRVVMSDRPREFSAWVHEWPHDWRVRDDGRVDLVCGDSHPVLIFEPARYTASLDAALALTERVLPGFFPGIQQYPDGWGAEMVYPEPRRDRMGTHFAICSDHNRFPTPSLALLAALLSAKIAEQSP